MSSLWAAQQKKRKLLGTRVPSKQQPATSDQRQSSDTASPRLPKKAKVLRDKELKQRAYAALEKFMSGSKPLTGSSKAPMSQSSSSSLSASSIQSSIEAESSSSSGWMTASKKRPAPPPSQPRMPSQLKVGDRRHFLLDSSHFDDSDSDVDLEEVGRILKDKAARAANNTTTSITTTTTTTKQPPADEVEDDDDDFEFAYKPSEKVKGESFPRSSLQIFIPQNKTSLTQTFPRLARLPASPSLDIRKI